MTFEKLCSHYDALSRAQEILDLAGEAGYFEGCRGARFPRWDNDAVRAKASALLGEEFDDVEVDVRWSSSMTRFVAKPGPFYRPGARASAARRLPEEVA